VAINRLIAANDAAKDHVVTLLDHFRHVSPNGEHDCLVFEPMGPDIVACFGRSIPDQHRRSIGRQFLSAQECIHDLGVVHSDMNPGNLHFSVTQAVDDLSLEAQSMSMPVDGQRNPRAPRHSYEDQPLTDFCDLENSVKVKLSDFGSGT